jgi:hypothetical protein
MQQGRYAASVVRARLRGREYRAFRYRDKGNLATIGRAAAVADIKGIQLSGFPAWATWLLVHLFYLIGFQNRLLVLIRWSFSFATHGRGAGLIKPPGQRVSSARAEQGRPALTAGMFPWRDWERRQQSKSLESSVAASRRGESFAGSIPTAAIRINASTSSLRKPVINPGDRLRKLAHP